MKTVRLTLVCVCSIIVGLMLTRGSYAVIDPEGIAGIWLLDEGKGDIVEDTSENGNDGTIKGNPEWVEGKFGKALKFDGVDGFVEVLSPNIGTGEELTVSVLVKPDVQTLGNHQDHKDIVRSHQHGGGTWGICTRGGFNVSDLLQIHVAWIEGGDLWWSPAGAVAVKDEWNYLVVVWDRGEGKATFYHNGQHVAETKVAVGAKPATRGFSIASDWAGPFQGIIDEVAIFNVALSEADIELIGTKGIERALGMAAIDLSDKLTTTWAQVKSGY